jgi:surface protein
MKIGHKNKERQMKKTFFNAIRGLSLALAAFVIGTTNASALGGISISNISCENKYNGAVRSDFNVVVDGLSVKVDDTYFDDAGDYLRCELEIANNSSDEVTINEESISNMTNENISYTLSHNGDNLIAVGGTKAYTLDVEYLKEYSESQEIDNNVEIKMAGETDTPTDPVDPTEPTEPTDVPETPNTGLFTQNGDGAKRASLFVGIIASLIVVTMITIRVISVRKSRKSVLKVRSNNAKFIGVMALLAATSVASFTFALTEATVTVENKIIISVKEYEFMPRAFGEHYTGIINFVRTAGRPDGLQGDPTEIQSENSEGKIYYLPSNDRQYGYYWTDDDRTTSNIYLNPDSSRMFENFGGTKTIDTTNWDWRRVENSSFMFHVTPSLVALDMENINMPNNTNMEQMFCQTGMATQNGSDINLKNLYAPNVTNANMLFNGSTIANLDFSNADLSKVESPANYTYGNGMFSKINQNRPINATINLANTKFSSLQNASSMFAQTVAKKIILTNFDISNATDASWMFASTSLLPAPYGYDLERTSDDPETIISKGYAIALELIDINTMKTGKVENMSYFLNRSGVATIDLSNMDVHSVRNFSYLINHCPLLTYAKLDNLEFNQLTNTSFVLQHNGHLQKVDINNFVVNNDDDYQSAWLVYYNSRLTEVNANNWNVPTLSSGDPAFTNNYVLAKLEANNWNVRNMVATSGVGQRHLITMNASRSDVGLPMGRLVVNANNWSMPNVESLAYFWYEVDSAVEINAKNWDLPKITDVNHIFALHDYLEKIDVTGTLDKSTIVSFNRAFEENEELNTVVGLKVTSAAKDLFNLFINDKKLKNIDTSQWDVSGVEDMRFMFYANAALESIDVSNWNTHNVKHISDSFGNCPNLTLDLSNLDMTSVEDLYDEIDGYQVFHAAYPEISPNVINPRRAI